MILLLRTLLREEDRIVDGINGFGSLPYTIKSHAILFDDEETIRKRKQEWLEQYLQIEVR